MRHHTGTHLLHAALRETLGPHVKQAGSLVEPARLRFDFTHFAGVSPRELRHIENRVNGEILKDTALLQKVMGREEALAYGALAFFGDKYGDTVRVVSIPDNRDGGHFSAELCGGTHVHETGEVGFFTILSDSSIGSGVRRLEALTGTGAERWIADRIRYLDSATRLLNTSAVGAAYAFNVGNVVIEAADLFTNTNLQVLDSFYTETALVDHTGAAITMAPASGQLGAVTRAADWTAGWTYGLHPGSQGQPLWFGNP